MENVKNNIRINAVLPGSTRTPMLEQTLALGDAVEQMILNSVPCGRFGSPEEIAEAVVWLCSDGASYINGHSLIADGGTLCR
jgi:NAD(P)-dependent dehydrogenase (short-subunit alcohol dehydrogenase family)